MQSVHIIDTYYFAGFIATDSVAVRIIKLWRVLWAKDHLEKLIEIKRIDSKIDRIVRSIQKIDRIF